MRKILLIFALIPICAHAETVITIPVHFLNEITKTIEFKTDLNYLQRVLITQIIKNSSLNGIKLKDYKADTLLKYFNNDDIFRQIGKNKLMEPYTGATLEFNSDNKCNDEDECSITVDFNGDFGPNEFWIKKDEPKDKIIFKIKRDDEKGLLIFLPEYEN